MPVNKKYIITDELQKLINWESIMKMERSAGGHDEQMQALFKDAEIIGHWNEGNWEGMVATCVKLPDNRFAIYNDYYGSCSGCDSWENATDEEVKNMCIDLANGAYVFESIKDIKDFLQDTSKENKEGNYDWFDTSSNCATNLFASIKE